MAEKLSTVRKEEWQPLTNLGKMVKSGEIITLEQIFDMGKPILEPEIIDVLLEQLESETLEVRSTQRVTDSGKRTQFRVVVVVGDKKGHVGIGVGKCDELKPSVDYAIRNAKKSMISVQSSCGSWECKCNVKHSLSKRTQGKEGSTVIVLKPAPRGLGLAANDVVKKVLFMAGINDVWSFSKGGGSNTYNTAMATIYALDNLNKLKELNENSG